MSTADHPSVVKGGTSGGLVVGQQSSALSEQGAAMAESQRSEIESAITVALRFPRNEDDAYGMMIKAAKRPTFQEKAIYKYPRGGQDIKGPSVNLAREFARVWKNLRYGFEVVTETEERCHVRGFAWDMETNTKVVQDASFKLLVYRKGRGWVEPDERDKRELINKHGSICERNCLLKVLPRDMVEDIMAEIERNQKRGVADDLENSRKKIVAAFGGLGIAASSIEAYISHPIGELNTDEIVALRQVYQSIKDGNSKWSDYTGTTKKGDAPKKTLAELMSEPEPETEPDPTADTTETEAADDGDVALIDQFIARFNEADLLHQEKVIELAREALNNQDFGHFMEVVNASK